MCQRGGEAAFKPCTSAVIETIFQLGGSFLDNNDQVVWGEKDGEGERKRWEENCRNLCDPTIHAYAYSYFSVVFSSLKAFCTSEGF